jgi:hypothetical protein
MANMANPPTTSTPGTTNGDYLRVIPSFDDHRSYDLQGRLRLNNPDAVCATVRRLPGIKSATYNVATACLGITLEPNGSWDTTHRRILGILMDDLGRAVEVQIEPCTVHED